MQCSFCFPLSRFPATSAPQQIQYLPQKSSPDLLRNLALLWMEQDVSLSILQTSVFSRLLNTWFGMLFPHILMEIQHTPVMAWKTRLFLLSAKVDNTSRTYGNVSQTARTKMLLSVSKNRAFTQPLCCLQLLASATTSLFHFEGIWLE